MNTVKQILDGSVLENIIPLPEAFYNAKLEVTIKAISYEGEKTQIARHKLRESLEGSVAQSLAGALPYSDMTLEDFREERLGKYERAD